MLQGASLETEASSPTKLPLNSSDHSGRSRNGLPGAVSMSSFFFLFLVSVESRKWSPSARLRLLLLRVFAGQNHMLSSPAVPMFKMYS